MKLQRANIERELRDYIQSVNSIEVHTMHGDILEFLECLKRKPLGSGPYPNVSLFEASNRILSDMVILFGVRRLLNNPIVGHVQLQFTEYEVSLGIKGGNDVTATADNSLLVGEAFNVARSLFGDKKRATVKKLNTQEDADYRLIIFNADAVPDPEYYIETSKPSMVYLPVNIWLDRQEIA